MVIPYTTKRRSGGRSEIYSGGRLVGIVTMTPAPRTYWAALVRPTAPVYSGPSKQVAEGAVIAADRAREQRRAAARQPRMS